MSLRDAKSPQPSRPAVVPDALPVPPNLALGFARARQRERAGDLAGAARELDFVAHLESIRPDEWALARETAQLLQRAGALAASAQLYTRLLSDPQLPPALQEAWEPEAHAVSDAAETKK